WRWTSGVPSSRPRLQRYLQQRTGYHWPALSRLRHRGAARVIATVIRDNTDPHSTLGLRAKFLAGLVYARTVGDATLEEAGRALATRAGVAPEQLAALDGRPAALDAPMRAALELARAAAGSPAQIGPDDVTAALDRLPAPAIIE